MTVTGWHSVMAFSPFRLRIPLEDDAIVSERGVEWIYQVNNRILLIGS